MSTLKVSSHHWTDMSYVRLVASQSKQSMVRISRQLQAKKAPKMSEIRHIRMNYSGEGKHDQCPHALLSNELLKKPFEPI